jgi:restriction system protein
MDPQFKPAIGLMDKLVPGKREELQNAADTAFDQARQQWRDIQRGNEILDENYHDACAQWEADKKAHQKSQIENNLAREQRLKDFLAKKFEVILDYFEMVLYSGRDEDYFPHQFKIEYEPFEKILIAAYGLPEFKNMPTLKEVRYNPTTRQFEEIFFNEEMQNLHYSLLAYQTALRIIHELFQSDLTNLLETVVFNGMVEKPGDAAGVCILSLEVSRKEFLMLNMNQIDAKAVFRQLKGVASSQWPLAAPVKPLREIGHAKQWGVMGDMLLTDLRGAVGLDLTIPEKKQEGQN